MKKSQSNTVSRNAVARFKADRWRETIEGIVLALEVGDADFAEEVADTVASDIKSDTSYLAELVRRKAG